MRGIIVLNWLCFMRPWAFSYGIVGSLPIFQIGFIVVFISALMRNAIKLRFPGFLILHSSFHIWILLSNLFAYKPHQSWAFYISFMVTLPIVSIFLFACIRDLKTLKWVLWASSGSLAILAAKVGAASAAKGGVHITQQIDGFVGDNNVFGLTICLAMACAFGLRNTLTKKWVIALFYSLISAAFLCIVFTKSRGAFLSMSIILLISTIASRTPIRNTFFLVAFAFIGYLSVPASYFDRLNTFENIEEDDSAMSRIFFWDLSWKQALDNPIFGIGLDNHQDYNAEVTPDLLGSKPNHVAHSVYFQVLAETGFVGFFMYIGMLFYTVVVLHKAFRSTRSLVKLHPDLKWVSPLAFWMRNGFIGYIFGSAFLNMLPIDFPWYFMWYANIFPWVLKRELVLRSQIAE